MKKFVIGALLASGTVVACVTVLSAAAIVAIRDMVEADRRKVVPITSLGEAIGVISVMPQEDDR